MFWLKLCLSQKDFINARAHAQLNILPLFLYISQKRRTSKPFFPQKRIFPPYFFEQKAYIRSTLPLEIFGGQKHVWLFRRGGMGRRRVGRRGRRRGVVKTMAKKKGKKKQKKEK